jgi:hypothetical protein
MGPFFYQPRINNEKPRSLWQKQKRAALLAGLQAQRRRDLEYMLSVSVAVLRRAGYGRRLIVARVGSKKKRGHPPGSPSLCPKGRNYFLATIDQIAPTRVITPPEISAHTPSSTRPLVIRIPPPKVKTWRIIPIHCSLERFNISIGFFIIYTSAFLQGFGPA